MVDTVIIGEFLLPLWGLGDTLILVEGRWVLANRFVAGVLSGGSIGVVTGV